MSSLQTCGQSESYYMFHLKLCTDQPQCLTPRNLRTKLQFHHYSLSLMIFFLPSNFVFFKGGSKVININSIKWANTLGAQYLSRASFEKLRWYSREIAHSYLHSSNETAPFLWICPLCRLWNSSSGLKLDLSMHETENFQEVMKFSESHW